MGDPTWTPLQPNYPNPDYDSGHSVEGGAAAQVLEEFFGTDNIGFTACSLTLPAGQQVHGSISCIPLVRQLLPGSGGERVYRGFSLAFTSATPLKRALNTVERSANVLSICFCDRCIDVA